MTIEKLTRARAAMIMSQPFFATLALHLDFVEDSTAETMWTDGRSIGYSPAFVGECTLSELQGVIAHEVMHCANGHHVRRGNRDAARWNKACDYAINPDLIAAGFSLPKGALINPAFANLGAEEIFRQLGDQPDQSGKDQQPGGKDQQPGGQPQAGNQQQPGASAPAGGNDPGACGEIRDAAPAHCPAELSAAESEWKANVRQALAVAKAQNAGTVPGHLARLDVETIKPRIDWRGELRRFIDQSNVKDFSWSRPNRRFIGQGLILPGFVSDSLSHLVVAIDTSGSIDREALSAFAAELGAALDEGAADRVTVIYCDAAVKGTATFERGESLSISPVGGGGTRFSPAMDWIDQNAPDASAVVYFTDLICNDFGDEPGAPVLWAAWGDPRKIDEMAKRVPYGEVMHLAA